MKKYIVSADVTLSVVDVLLYVDDDVLTTSLDFNEALREALVATLKKRLALLDYKGGLSGYDGFAVDIEVTNWDLQ